MAEQSSKGQNERNLHQAGEDPYFYQNDSDKNIDNQDDRLSEESRDQSADTQTRSNIHISDKISDEKGEKLDFEGDYKHKTEHSIDFGSISATEQSQFQSTNSDETNIFGFYDSGAHLNDLLLSSGGATGSVIFERPGDVITENETIAIDQMPGQGARAGNSALDPDNSVARMQALLAEQLNSKVNSDGSENEKPISVDEKQDNSGDQNDQGPVLSQVGSDDQQDNTTDEMQNVTESEQEQSGSEEQQAQSDEGQAQGSENSQGGDEAQQDAQNEATEQEQSGSEEQQTQNDEGQAQGSENSQGGDEAQQDVQNEATEQEQSGSEEQQAQNDEGQTQGSENSQGGDEAQQDAQNEAIEQEQSGSEEQNASADNHSEDSDEDEHEDDEDDHENEHHGHHDEDDEDDHEKEHHGHHDEDDEDDHHDSDDDQDEENEFHDNNGYGNGDQDAPGNSSENNNAENAQSEGAEQSSVELNQSNGIYDISSGGEVTLNVNYISSDAGYNSSHGFYVADADGNPIGGMIIEDNVKSFTDNVVTFDTNDYPGGVSVGFFIIPDGNDRNSGLSGGETVTFEQINGNWTPMVDGHALASAEHAPAYFSDTALNADGVNHMIDSAEDGNQNWEDLDGGGDHDYQDVNVDVSVFMEANDDVQGITVQGMEGAEDLQGGTGDDTLIYNSDSVWNGYNAHNVETGENVGLAGYNRSTDVFDGGDGHDILQGTSEDDALFLDDGISSFASGSQARIQNIEEIDMGDGNDIVDMTSSKYTYDQGITVHGGDGDDVIWTSTGNDQIDGGAGNDKLFGGDGDDTLTFLAHQGNDIVDGGAGGSWTDTIKIDGFSGELHEAGWTLTLDDGSSIQSTDDNASEILLSHDASGTITFDDGGSIDFENIEKIVW